MSSWDIPLQPPPAIYLNPLDTIAPGFASAVVQNQSTSESWVDTAMRVLPMLVTTLQQRQIISAQIQQARAGLPPLDMSTIAPQVNIGVSADTKTLLYGAGLLVAAVLILPGLMGGGSRRRR